MQKILVTGSSGFIGSRLVKRLKPDFTMDLRNGQDLMTCDLPDADIVYHLAAQTSVEESWKDPVKDSYNFNMTVRLAHRYPKAKIIFAQSAAACDCNSPYGISKYASGEYLKDIHKKSVICVLPNIYGGGKGVVDIFKNEKKVTIYGDGNQVRDFVHVDDIVEGLIKASKWKPGTYFMGSGIGTRIRDLAKGKKVQFKPARKEIEFSVLPNTTPNWSATIKISDFMK